MNPKDGFYSRLNTAEEHISELRKGQQTLFKLMHRRKTESKHLCELQLGY